MGRGCLCERGTRFVYCIRYVRSEQRIAQWLGNPVDFYIASGFIFELFVWFNVAIMLRKFIIICPWSDRLCAASPPLAQRPVDETVCGGKSSTSERNLWLSRRCAEREERRHFVLDTHKQCIRRWDDIAQMHRQNVRTTSIISSACCCTSAVSRTATVKPISPFRGRAHEHRPTASNPKRIHSFYVNACWRCVGVCVVCVCYL